MTTTTFTYRRGDELPGIKLPWQEETSEGVYANLDLSTGYTFSVTLTTLAGTAVTPAPTLTGYNGGVNVDWALGDLDITPDVYVLSCTARETATTKDRTWKPAQMVHIHIV